MRSHRFSQSSMGWSSRKLWAMGLGWLILGTLWIAPAQARAEDGDEAASVLVCDLTYTVKLKRLKKQFKTAGDDFSAMWSNARASDKKDACKRYFQVKANKRLSKLLELGKTNEVAYVVAPAADKSGRDVKLSFWLVDVAAEKLITEFETKVSSKPKQFTKDITGALEETTTVLLGALQTELAAKAPAADAESEADTEAAADPGEASADTGDDTSDEGAAKAAAAGDASEETTNEDTTSDESEVSAQNESGEGGGYASDDAASSDDETPTNGEDVDGATAAQTTKVKPANEKGSGLRNTLVAVSSGMIGAGVGGTVGGIVVSMAGTQIREWEKYAAVEPSNRAELDNILLDVAIWSDVATIALVGVGLIGGGILTSALLFVEE